MPLAAALLVLASPLVVVYLWIACRAYGCALDGPLTALGTGGLAALVAVLPRPTVAGFAIVLAWYALQAVLAIVLPGPTARGAVTPAGHVLDYRLNGALAWLVTHVLLYVAVVHWRLFPATLVWDHWGGVLVAANAVGVAVALVAWAKAHVAPTFADDRRFSGSAVYDFFGGIELNPRIAGFDVKLFHIGRIGMLAWTVVDASFAARQYADLGRLTTSMVVLNVLQLVYVVDLLWRERWYLKTIDIQHDRFGFYLAWGSVVWLPFTYTLQAAYLVAHPVDLSAAAAVGVLALGLVGYAIFLSANRQRDRFRRCDGALTIWGRVATFVPARYVTADGVEHQTRLLTAGWWGLARHANYLGDIMLATAFGLACGVGHVVPYLYAIYLSGLLVHRIWRDERRCRARYGSAWETYCALVPYRMIPGVW